MSNIKKDNDWFASLIFNPNLNTEGFREQGLNESNTELKPKDYYQTNDEVVKVFKKEDGSFDQNKFDKFYDVALNTYNKFVSDDINKNYSNKIETTENNIYALPDDIIIKPSYSIEQVNNIQLESVGTRYMFGTNDPKRSYREAAQTQNVFNTETNKFED